MVVLLSCTRARNGPWNREASGRTAAPTSPELRPKKSRRFSPFDLIALPPHFEKILLLHTFYYGEEKNFFGNHFSEQSKRYTQKFTYPICWLPISKSAQREREIIAQDAWKGDIMLLIRDIMYCRPGKVRPMVEKFLAMAKLSEKKGRGKMGIMTDLSAARYWTVVSEMEVPSLEAFMAMGQGSEEMKEFENIMKGYHDLVDYGRREIYTIEG